jgi:uncharacterized protein YndB with AHSA1/START domain
LSTGRTDRASLLLHVVRATAFAALTNPDALATWLPPAGMSGRFERFDMREGGSYRLVLTYGDASDAPGKTSADEDVSEVRIARIVPGERIVQDIDFESDDPAFRGTMRMEWSMHSVEARERAARGPGPRPCGGTHVVVGEPLRLPRAVGNCRRCSPTPGPTPPAVPC